MGVTVGEQKSRRSHDASKGRPTRKRRDKNAKSTGGSRSRTQTPRKPKPKPRPAVPLTEKMKKGNEPLRTFSDLAQFVDLKSDEDEKKTDKS